MSAKPFTKDIVQRKNKNDNINKSETQKIKWSNKH